ncbi:MAG: lytic transglycosylase domain-containing protein [Armatimonadota bacterium]
MKQTKLPIHLIVIILLAFTSNIYAIDAISAKQYMKLHKQLHTSIPIDTIKSNPSGHWGKVFEVVGVVQGVSSSGNQKTLIIKASDGSSYLLNTDSNNISVGTEIACLVKVGKESLHSLTDLQIQAWTYLVDLNKSAKPAASSQPNPQSAQNNSQQTASENKENQNQSQNTTSVDEAVRIFKNAVLSCNSKLTSAEADTIARSILGFSSHYKVDPRLVFAVILAESNFKPNATSRAGAQGLGQLMPGTAAGMGISNAYDPVENIYGATRYIRSMIDRTSGKDWNEMTWNDLAVALAAYNAGPGAVKKHGGIPPYRETQNYVKKVTTYYKQLCGVK